MRIQLTSAGQRAIALAAAGVLFPVGMAWADVTVERVVKFGGFMGMGAFQSTDTQYLSGEKSRTEGTRKFTGAILGAFVPDAKSVTITRLDKDLVWEIDEKKKTYTETSVSAAMERMRQAQEQQNQQGQAKPQDESGGAQEGEASEPQYKIVKNEMTLTKTAESKSIAGYEATKYILRWDVEAEDVQTKERINYLMVSDQWTATEDAALRQLREEEAAFAQAYAKKLTGDGSVDTSRKYGLAALGGVLDEASIAKFEKEIAKLEGYPVATHTRWSVGGDAAASPAPQAQTQEKEDPAPSMPTSVEGAMKSMGGVFGGLFGKGGGEAQQPAKEQAADDERAQLFDSATELKRIQTGSVPADKFELPANLKKVSQ